MDLRAIIAGLAALLVSDLAWAGEREDIVLAQVERIVVNSLDEPDRHEPYFSETRLLSEFSAEFVRLYSQALFGARRKGFPTLFEDDPMTGDANRCPIGKTSVRDLSRDDTPIMVEAVLDTGACDANGAPGRPLLRLMFFLVSDKVSGRPVIDDVTRHAGEGVWKSLQARLERLGRAED